MLSASKKLYTTAQVRAMDQYAIEKLSISAYTLMCRAGQALFDVLQARWPNASKVTVFCGAGNNAGDGYVVARLAQAQGLDVTVLHLADPRNLSGVAQQAYAASKDAGVMISAFEASSQLFDADNGAIIVDALLGTGLQREVSGDWFEAITQINQSGRPVIAADLPSGIHADCGAVMGIAVQADCTVSFIGRKRGLLTAAAVDYTGELHFDDLGAVLPDSGILGEQEQPCQLLDTGVLSILPRRQRNTHKGNYGHVLVIGGNHGMAGAVQLAGLAALRSGAGRVTVATRGSQLQQPELMTHVIEQAQQLRPLLEKASVILIGPGLGQDSWAQALLSAVLESEGSRPVVIDADGLNLLAAEPQQDSNHIITPHPGEAARLLGQSSKEIQSDRFTAATELQQRYGGVAVLKGAGTLVVGKTMSLCQNGNPGMATAGMGDVLAGVVAGLLAQGLDLQTAAQLAVWVHANAADRDASEQGERGMLASDLLPHIRQLLNGLQE